MGLGARPFCFLWGYRSEKAAALSAHGDTRSLFEFTGDAIENVSNKVYKY